MQQPLLTKISPDIVHEREHVEQWGTNQVIKIGIGALTWWIGVLSGNKEWNSHPSPHPNFLECGVNPSFLAWGTPVWEPLGKRAALCIHNMIWMDM